MKIKHNSRLKSDNEIEIKFEILISKKDLKLIDMDIVEIKDDLEDLVEDFIKEKIEDLRS